ncbi:MAG: helix-turn-helix domain-containing protein [Verrucomicrobia bacterium]|nr:MAG: helix-turn-helix domain-containing protein [Verrucomicrobiota bacterium]
MPTVGEQLRTAREAQRLSIHRVAEATKMRTDHVRAIEEGRYDVFAAPVYLHGFVRAYARFLKLDEQELLRQLDEECGRPAKPRSSPPPPPAEPAAAAEAGASWVKRWADLIHLQSVAVVVCGLVLAWLAWLWFGREANRGSGEEAAGAGGAAGAAYYAGGSHGLEDLLPLPAPADDTGTRGPAGS